MKKVSVKDLIIGALTAMLFIMLLGAGPNNNKVGRYTLSSSNSDKWGIVCVTDSLTGDTECSKTVQWAEGMKFSFTPKFR